MYIARYAHQPLSEIRKLSTRELTLAKRELSSIVGEENGPQTQSGGGSEEG